jgi:IclR family pca regulon transcriptional regulator
MTPDLEPREATGGVALTEEHSGDPDFMSSLARGLQVIRTFSEYRRNLTISQVSQATGLSRAAARRCLHTLSKLGYVGEDNKRYFLRPQVLTLGHAYLASTPLAVSAQPYLDEVSRTLRESCSAAVLDGDEIVYVCRSAETRIMSISLLVGTRLPAYCTAMGQVLLAHLPGEQLEKYLASVKLIGRTDRTVTTIPKLRKVLAQVREAGFAILDQELEVGLRSVAVPVRDARGVVVAAVNVGAHASRVTLDDMKTRFLPLLTKCANGLGSILIG